MASICIVCLALGGCTEDRLLPDSGTSSTVEPVAVKLTLGIDDYNTSSDAETRAEEMPPVLRMSSPDMDVELVATPVATRAGGTPTTDITEDNAVYSYMGFQFNGTKPDGTLVEKKYFASPDGTIKTDEVVIAPTPHGQKNRIVVLANVNMSTFKNIIPEQSTYADLHDLCMTLTGNDDIFPKNKLILTDANGNPLQENGMNVERTGIVMCGQADAEIFEGKQLYISLKRTVARVTFNITTTYQHFIEVPHTWNVTLMNIPTQNYYNVLGRKAIFPSEDLKEQNDLFWHKSLATTTAANPVIQTGPLYIPINLQQTVLTSTVNTRRDNAPTGGTYLQIIGLENKEVAGGMDLNIVTDFSIYQLFLGKNFTTDYSVYANYDLTYNIVLKGNSRDDTNVIRLIPGYFSGELTAYGAAGDTLKDVANQNAVKWKYPNQIESYFSDGYYPGSLPERKTLKWYEGSSFSNCGATSLTNGCANTLALQREPSTWGNYEAAYTCYRGTNGYNVGDQPGADKGWWYLPSVSELIGTWISSSSTQKQMAGSYWSSTADPSADKAFVVTNEGKVYSDAVGNTHAVRASQDPDKASHAGGGNK